MVYQSTIDLQAEWIEQDLDRILKAAESGDRIYLEVALEVWGDRIRATCERLRNLSALTEEVSS